VLAILKKWNILEDFFDVFVTKTKAEFVEKYFSKDRSVLVVEKLQRTKVIANEIEYTDWKICN
jgi:hypothetical protein